MRRIPLLPLLLAIVLAACGSAPVGPAAGAPKSEAELRYAVIAATEVPLICGAPVARAGDEDTSAASEYPAIKADAQTYRAILAHAHPAGDESSPAFQLAVWRQWRQLQAVTLGTPDAAGQRDFSLRSATVRYQGMVDGTGRVTVTVRERAFMPSCPICLAATTLIDTPGGPRPVISLRIGDVVFTTAPDGRRVAASLVDVGSVAFPLGRPAVDLKLADGRRLIASAAHPLAGGRAIGSLKPGESVGGAIVAAVTLVNLPPGSTYDILPAGPTGQYWAGGILLASTMARPAAIDPPSLSR